MRKYILLLCMLLILLYGCQSTQGNTLPTKGTAESSAVETTQPAEINYHALFSELGSWYNMALVTEYSKPQELRLCDFFYNGFHDEEDTATDEEWTQLKDIPGFQEEFDLIRLPAAKMDAVLQKHFGISLTQMEKSCFEGLVYLESIDCYYMMHSDAKAAEKVRIKDTVTGTDGSICVIYTAACYEEEYIVTLIPTDNDFQIWSNRPWSQAVDYYTPPKNLLVEIYKPYEQYRYYNRYGVDTTQCKERWLYVFNYETKEIITICNEPVAMASANYFGVFYVTQADPRTVIYATLDGQKKTAVYKGNNITHIDAFGNKEEKLGVIENETEVYIYDFVQGTKTMVYSQPGIERVRFFSGENDIWIEFYISDSGRYYNITTKESGLLPECS